MAKIGFLDQKPKFLAQKKVPLLDSNHVLATTRKSCSKKKSAFAQIIKGEMSFWVIFWGPKFGFLVQKSDFCHTTPILVDDPFLALGMMVNFLPWKRFFVFPFRSYSCFRKKIRLTAQKVFPPPTMGAPSASNSPSALSARAG